MASYLRKELFVLGLCLIQLAFGQNTPCSSTDLCTVGCCGNGGIDGNE